ncbi:protein kinase [Candidatus Uabimicrobium sp. HlEnr_7]|uniref:protein kinase domain-containing protein n=1 Tax=Candidatus Uabimicrobium helgolandensis TaxID=3095367 RepID=UPI003556B489
MSTGFHKNLPELPAGYEYVRELSSGNYGIVWLVHNNNVKRDEAIKILFRKGETDYHRFCREIETMATLNHPNIVTVYYAKPDELYFIMEYLETSFSSWLKQKECSSYEGIKHLYQVAKGLHFAHEKELIHRDLKPGNVLFTKDMVPKITDFGLVKNTGFSSAGEDDLTGSLSVGTPRYMSPEQWEDSKVIDCRSDIWSLGVMLYEVIAKENPFADLSGFQLADAIIRKPILLPSQVNVNPNLWDKIAEPICMKALNRDLNKRYQTAYEMAKDLEKIFNIDEETMEVATEERSRPISFSATAIRLKNYSYSNKTQLVKLAWAVVVCLGMFVIFVFTQKQHENELTNLKAKYQDKENDIIKLQKKLDSASKVLDDSKKQHKVQLEEQEVKIKSYQKKIEDLQAQQIKLLKKYQQDMSNNKNEKQLEEEYHAKLRELQTKLQDQKQSKELLILEWEKQRKELTKKYEINLRELIIERQKNRNLQQANKERPDQSNWQQKYSVVKNSNEELQNEIERLIAFENALYKITLITKSAKSKNIVNYLQRKGFFMRRPVGVTKTQNVCIYFSKKNPPSPELENKINYIVTIMKKFGIKMQKRMVRGGKEREKEIKLELKD